MELVVGGSDVVKYCLVKKVDQGNSKNYSGCILFEYFLSFFLKASLLSS